MITLKPRSEVTAVTLANVSALGGAILGKLSGDRIGNTINDQRQLKDDFSELVLSATLKHLAQKTPV